MPMYVLLKKKIIQKKNQKQKDQKMLLNMIASVYSRRCESYRIYLEGDNPYQAIMIVCKLE